MNSLDRFCSELNGTRAHEQGLQDILVGDIRLDAAALDADAGIAVAKLVTMAQLGDNLDAVETGVLGERRRDDFHGVGKGLEADGFGARETARLLGQLAGNLNLGRPATGNQRFLLHQASNDAEGVVQRPLGLVEDERVGATAHNRYRLAR